MAGPAFFCWRRLGPSCPLEMHLYLYSGCSRGPSLRPAGSSLPAAVPGGSPYRSPGRLPGWKLMEKRCRIRGDKVYYEDSERTRGYKGQTEGFSGLVRGFHPLLELSGAIARGVWIPRKQTKKGGRRPGLVSNVPLHLSCRAVFRKGKPGKRPQSLAVSPFLSLSAGEERPVTRM